MKTTQANVTVYEAANVSDLVNFFGMDVETLRDAVKRGAAYAEENKEYKTVRRMLFALADLQAEQA